MGGIKNIEDEIQHQFISLKETLEQSKWVVDMADSSRRLTGYRDLVFGMSHCVTGKWARVCLGKPGRCWLTFATEVPSSQGWYHWFHVAPKGSVAVPSWILPKQRRMASLRMRSGSLSILRHFTMSSATGVVCRHWRGLHVAELDDFLDVVPYRCKS